MCWNKIACFVIANFFSVPKYLAPFYSVFHQFRQVKFDFGGSIVSLRQFLLMPQQPLKMTLALKVVKMKSKIIFLLSWSKLAKQTVKWCKNRLAKKFSTFNTCNTCFDFCKLTNRETKRENKTAILGLKYRFCTFNNNIRKKQAK